MDLTQFRKHLARIQNLKESRQAQLLGSRLFDLPKYLSNNDRLKEIAAVRDELDSIPNLNKRTRQQLLQNLDELEQAVRARDFDDAEILVQTLVAQFKRL